MELDKLQKRKASFPSIRAKEEESMKMVLKLGAKGPKRRDTGGFAKHSSSSSQSSNSPQSQASGPFAIMPSLSSEPMARLSRFFKFRFVSKK